MTAVNGAVVWSAMYGSFGQAFIDSASIVENNLRFPGQYYDGETGMHYNYHRYYDPGTGRYLTPDPIGFEGDDVNLYAYVWNNPVNAVDPTGEFGIVGGVIGAGMDLGLQLAMNGGNWKCVDWADVAISGAVGIIAPGAFSSAKKVWKVGKYAYKSHKKIKNVKKLRYKKRLTQRRNRHAGRIANEIAVQGVWQGSKNIAKKTLNVTNESDCNQEDPCK